MSVSALQKLWTSPGCRGGILSWLIFLGVALVVRGAETPGAGGERLILAIEGKVEVWPAGANDWAGARTNQTLKIGDQIRTGFRSRATLQLSDLTVMRMNQLTTLEIQPPKNAPANATLDVQSGGVYFLGRDKPKQTDIRTPQTSGAILGTEFALEVTPDGRTVLTLIDGAVELSNEAGRLALASGEQGAVRQGQKPEKTAVIDAVSIVQWALYYPAVLDPDELELGAVEQQALATSLTAYRAGDLLGAVAEYPEGRKPAGEAEKVYLAGIVLAVGQVSEAESLLKEIPAGAGRAGRLAEALRLMITAVRGQETGVRSQKSGVRSQQELLVTELLARSYAAQGAFKLDEALEFARAAAEKSGRVGFAAERLAELEFGFGRTAASKAALDRALTLSPRHAQAMALQGFVLAARNRTMEAGAAFDRAIAADPALGNGWLGRGLVKIRSGHANEGRADLQVAASIEPRRALLRSYLGKAFVNARDAAHARHELELAKKLDPNDPTAWLYSALLAQQENEVNRSVENLERSRELNDNRRLFRSRLLLDQDRAVRGANLAQVYRDAGMFDLSRREAGRAVDADYANASAHLFLAESYDALRDPNQVNLRYETPWLSELLVANLLAPVGAGPLSQNISQQEYSRLLERDRLGVSASTEYLSRGDWNHTSSQFGTFGNTGYAIDAEYHSSPGQRVNNDREQLTVTGKFKQQFTPQDSLLVQTIYYDAAAGDLAQYYDPAKASRTMRLTEKQEPNLFAGWHHEWTPESHTLALIGRLHDDFTLIDPAGTTLTFNRNAAGEITGTVPRGFGLDFGSKLEAFNGELQHILQHGGNTLIAGGRVQAGSVDNRAALELRRGTFPGPDVFPPNTSVIDGSLNRYSLYAYDHWQLLDSLRLSAGLTYDHIEFPLNSEIPPLDGSAETRDKFSPKVGIEWNPCANATVRGVYTRSLGGLFFDQSVRLEPTQIAGFNQAFRSLIPESVAGLVPGTEFETAGAALDLKFKSRTYVSFSAETLWSEGDRVVGGFDRLAGVLAAAPSGSRELLDFRERTAGVVLNQLLGENWSLGASYRLSQAELNDSFVSVPSTASASGGFSARRDIEGLLQQVNLYARFHCRCGFFGELGSLWTTQSNRGYAPDLPGDDFWQFNAFAGYRFLQRRAEVKLGLLNIGDQDYRVNPLNLTYELPRGRTLAASLKFTF